MPITRRRRLARKLVLPLLALGLMTVMMGIGASRQQPYRPPVATQSR